MPPPLPPPDSGLAGGPPAPYGPPCPCPRPCECSVSISVCRKSPTALAGSVLSPVDAAELTPMSDRALAIALMKAPPPGATAVLEASAPALVVTVPSYCAAGVWAEGCFRSD